LGETKDFSGECWDQEQRVVVDRSLCSVVAEAGTNIVLRVGVGRELIVSGEAKWLKLCTGMLCEGYVLVLMGCIIKRRAILNYHGLYCAVQLYWLLS